MVSNIQLLSSVELSQDISQCFFGNIFLNPYFHCVKAKFLMLLMGLQSANSTLHSLMFECNIFFAAFAAQAGQK